jgi:hypothetical protein
MGLPPKIWVSIINMLLRWVSARTIPIPGVPETCSKPGMGVNLRCLGIRKASRHPLYVVRLISRVRRTWPASPFQNVHLRLNMASRFWNTVRARSNIGQWWACGNKRARRLGCAIVRPQPMSCFDPPRFRTGNWGLGSFAYRHSCPLLLYYSIHHTNPRTEDASQTIARDIQTWTPLPTPNRGSAGPRHFSGGYLT